MEPTQNLLAILTTAIGALLQGVTGLGLNLFASPLLMMIQPRLVPGPIMAGALLLTILMVLRDRSGIDLFGIGWMAAGMLPGTILAGFLLPVLPHKTLAITLGILVLVGVAISLAGFPFPSKPWVLFLAGFVSGVGGTLASIGGPPVALVNQRMEPRKLRATLSGYFILSGIAALATLVPAGKFGSTEAGLSIWILIGVLLGFVGSSALISKISGKSTRYVVLALSAVSGLALIIQQI